MLSACQCRLHCENCRNNPKAQRGIGAPEICPYGYTKDNLPKIINKKSTNISRSISISKSKIDYCPHFKKPCCSRKTGYCNLIEDSCTTDGVIRCDLANS